MGGPSNIPSPVNTNPIDLDGPFALTVQNVAHPGIEKYNNEMNEAPNIVIFMIAPSVVIRISRVLL